MKLSEKISQKKDEVVRENKILDEAICKIEE